MFQMKFICIIITVKMNSNGRSEKFYKRPAVQHIGIVELVAEDPSAPAPALALEAESGAERGERLVAGGPGPLQSAASSLTENTRTAGAGLDTGNTCYRYKIIK